MNFFRIASQSKLTAFAALAAGGVLLGACDSTIEGGGTGGAGGGEESSATGVSQGGAPQQSSSVSAAGGGNPGGANAIALRASDLPDGGGETVSVTTVGVGGYGQGGYEEGSVVAVGAGGSPDDGAGGWSSTGGDETGVGGSPQQSGVGGGPAGEGGYGTSDVGVGVGGGSSGEGGYGSGVGGGSPGWDPDTLILFISNDLVECVDPFGSADDCGERQVKAIINLPPAYQQVGVYSLSDEALNAFFSETQGDGNICEGGGGSFWDGTLEVLEVNDSFIRVQLAGTSPADLDGIHDVLRCSSGPTPPPLESSVIAYFPSGLPPQHEGGDDTSSVTTGTGNPGEESFVINFANHAQVCSNVYGGEPGPGQTFESFNILLPPSYLVPGVYSLEDPAITTLQFELSENTGSAASGAPGGQPGTLTILEVTPGYIDLELEGTQFDFANGAGQVPRCD